MPDLPEIYKKCQIWVIDLRMESCSELIQLPDNIGWVMSLGGTDWAGSVTRGH